MAAARPAAHAARPCWAVPTDSSALTALCLPFPPPTALYPPPPPHRVCVQANRLQTKMQQGASLAARSAPARLQNRNPHARPSAAAAAPSASSSRERRAPRDEREAKKMEQERFHALLLSLDVSLDKNSGNKSGCGGKKTERKEPLKGVFASSQEYVDTFGPLVMEEVRDARKRARMACASACALRPLVTRMRRTRSEPSCCRSASSTARPLSAPLRSAGAPSAHSPQWQSALLPRPWRGGDRPSGVDAARVESLGHPRSHSCARATSSLVRAHAFHICIHLATATGAATKPSRR